MKARAFFMINRDRQGRYSLKDLHAAAGGEEQHSTGYWLAKQSTQELIDAYTRHWLPDPIKGEYVIRELAINYAEWVGARFPNQVLRE